jgi:predicted Zn-dependent protease
MQTSGWKKIVVGLLTALILSPISVYSQGARQQKTAKSLPDKKNPLMIGRRNINRLQINFYSIDKEIAFGQQLAAQVEMQLPILNDPTIAEYVNRVGQNLVLHSDAKVPFTIKVIASDEVNAFALPGGFFYVNLGVLKTADSEAELAGVMAHEIAHVAARHALENLSKAELLSLAAVPLIFVGGPVGELGRAGAELGMTALVFKFSRGAEREADELGAQYMWAAGYDPMGLITFFEKLHGQQRRPRVSPLFQTHPATADRIANVRKLIARFPERESYAMNTREFDDIKNRLLARGGVKPGDIGRRTTDEPRPPVLHRRTEDTTPPPAGSESPQPPVLHRRDSSSEPTERTSSESTSTTTASGGERQPPRLIRNTSPEAQSQDGSSPTHTDRSQAGQPSDVRQSPPGELSDTGALKRTPPRLRRRY